MPKRQSKLIGPFVVQVESRIGNWKNTTVETIDEAKQIGSRTISKWQDEGLYRLKEGANLFVDDLMTQSKTLRIFNANDKLVTNEVLAS